MGQAGVDVKLYGDARKLIPYSIECKASEVLKIPEWVKQAKENKEKDNDWLLIVKQSRQEPIVFMELETFLNLLQDKIDLKES